MATAAVPLPSTSAGAYDSAVPAPRIYLDHAASTPMDPVARDEFVRLLEVEEATYNPIGNVGSVFFLHTDLGAPRGRP